MTGALAIGGPFVTAAAGVTLRHRVGAWASWLFIMVAGYLQARYLSSPPWWTQPEFLAGLDEGVGLLGAAFLMSLLVHQFGPQWPSWAVQVAATATVGLLTAWANAHLSPSTTLTSAFLIGCGVWLVALLGRDWQRWRQSKRHPPRPEV